VARAEKLVLIRRNLKQGEERSDEEVLLDLLGTLKSEEAAVHLCIGSDYCLQHFDSLTVCDELMTSIQGYF
jgi:hypothetical protein